MEGLSPYRCNYVEESIKNATRAFMHEPNDAGAWTKVKCMIDEFQNSMWKGSSLGGDKSEKVYEVHVRLGDTMTPKDI